ncbi:MAG: cellulase family glycosylhydrolase [Anaerolineaceae bacterium]|nr:cellulase family glycosylhydrolase [Anaerolineaceae bacterium]
MQTSSQWFLDSVGRRMLLRGVNLSGASKVPVEPNGATHLREGFFNHREVSFVGRPFPLAEADEHFRRLRHWGLTTLRLLTTWEAIEHVGPGIYDKEYLDYLTAVVNKAGEYGLRVFIDPHQDVWSRFSGGDGAPGWTLEAVGLNLETLHATGAAFVHAMVGDDYPRMIWFTNGYKLASATMFMLFFAGNEYAPLTMIDGKPAQEYLQSHYIAAIKQIASRLKGLPWVIGYDSLNEPSDGWIGMQNLAAHETENMLGETPTPFQSMMLGDGIPTEVDFLELQGLGVKKTGTHLLNPDGLRAWQGDQVGVWRANGVWDYDDQGQPKLLRPDYFARYEGRQVEFNNDFLKPFINRFGEEIRQVDPGKLIFIESVPHKTMPTWTEEDISGIVDSSHWYDDLTLITKQYRAFAGIDLITENVVLGSGRVKKMFRRVLGGIKSRTMEKLGDVPTLIGEFGIPYDMYAKKAYETGNFSKQELALDRSFQALEANLLHATLWNYTPDNSNAHGDLWNEEDLSIFSRDQQTNPMDIDSGARAPTAFIRPYPQATAGEPLALSFNMRSKCFKFSFLGDPTLTAPTEIFVPEYHYGAGIKITVSDGTYDYQPEIERLYYWPEDPAGEHWVEIKPA